MRSISDRSEFRCASWHKIADKCLNKNGFFSLRCKKNVICPDNQFEKQEKYNINRWALTGRDDLRVNTKCYQIYKAFENGNAARPVDEDWKELCFLWSSDFRTHITQDRWDSFIPRLDRFCEKDGNILVIVVVIVEAAENIAVFLDKLNGWVVFGLHFEADMVHIV